MVRKISLFGYGKTMKSLGKILAPCAIYDDSFSTESTDFYGNLLLPPSAFKPAESSLEIISPGIPPHWDLAKKARNLTSEYDYFYANGAPFSIWISGTNGKTTTTEMTQTLLKSRGSVCGGNIGTPICELPRDAAIWTLETSSFTLHYTNRAAPNIYILLPITPDHLSWHGSFEAYQNAKLKPLLLMKCDSHAIIPEIYKDSTQTRAFQGKIYFYNSAESLAKIFGIKLESLPFKGAFLLDAALAMAGAKIASGETNYGALKTFRIGAHKIEEFRDKGGRIFVDDSKATNIDATLEALKIYAQKRILLILGGDNKGVSLEPLIAELTQYQVKVFAIGACEAHIVESCAKYGVACVACGILESAMKAIDKEMQDSDICLLSPACASLDQFSSYKERGERFKNLALKF